MPALSEGLAVAETGPRRGAARDGLYIILYMPGFVERKMIEFVIFMKIFLSPRVVLPGFILIYFWSLNDDHSGDRLSLF